MSATYGQDPSTWTQAQAASPEQGRYERLDPGYLAEEMAASRRRAVRIAQTVSSVTKSRADRPCA